MEMKNRLASVRWVILWGKKSSHWATRRWKGKDKKGTKRGEDGETNVTRNSAQLMGIIFLSLQMN
jgi:glycerol-3-phosphate acyltransferase PlsY